ncbi:MAG: 5-formyltetrahydrofolate cyclo-ligase [Brevinema sp.]
MNKSKQELRKEALIKRSFLQGEISEDILEDVKNIIIIKKRVIAFYYPLKGELSLKPLWEYALESGVEVLFPRVMGECEMVMCRVYSERDFEEGAFGIMEPKTLPYKGEIDLIFVPALMLGKDGSRLGFGKGYYDRFLFKHQSTMKIGVVWDELLAQKTPMEAHDFFMGAILTEKQLFFVE